MVLDILIVQKRDAHMVEQRFEIDETLPDGLAAVFKTRVVAGRLADELRQQPRMVDGQFAVAAQIIQRRRHPQRIQIDVDDTVADGFSIFAHQRLHDDGMQAVDRQIADLLAAELRVENRRKRMVVADIHAPHDGIADEQRGMRLDDFRRDASIQ